MTSHIYLSAICVRNLESAGRFYTAVLDLKADAEWVRPECGLKGKIFRDSKGAGFEIVEACDLPPTSKDEFKNHGFTRVGATHITFAVPDIFETVKLAREHGAEVMLGPEEGKTVAYIAVLRDPDGILFQILEPKK